MDHDGKRQVESDSRHRRQAWEISEPTDWALIGHPAAGIRQRAFVSSPLASGILCGAVEGAAEGSGLEHDLRHMACMAAIPIKRPGCEVWPRRVLITEQLRRRTLCLLCFRFLLPDLIYTVLHSNVNVEKRREEERPGAARSTA